MTTKAFTYGDLLKQLGSLSKAQLKKPVTAYSIDSDETFELDELSISGKEEFDDCRPDVDELGKNHPYLVRY